MRRLSISFKNHKIVIWSGIIIGLGLAGGILYHITFYQISQTYAQEACQKFFQDIKSQITAVPGYKVINGIKGCNANQDEAGFTDYNLAVEFRVSAEGNDSVAAIKSNIKYLSSKLPIKDYSVWLVNVPAKDGLPVTICVNASEYLNNDGQYIPQGASGNHPRYTEPGTIESLRPCSDL